MIATRFNPLGVRHKPYDAEVEYLETTGTQWIDTGLFVDNTFTFDAKVAMTLSADANTVFWGIRTAGVHTSKDSQCYLNVNAPLQETICLFSTNTYLGSPPNWDSRIAPEIGVMYDLRGMTVTPTMSEMKFSIILFGFNNIGAINSTVGVCRMGGWAAYSNGKKVMSLIPVRVGDIGYMYDKVSGKLFGNQGTGQFVLGEDK